MFLNRLTINLARIWYTIYCSGLLLLGFIIKGKALFEKKHRDKPNCLEGWDSRYVKLQRIRLHYVQTGSDDKPLMLFIHGYPEFWYSWRFQLEEFKNDYRCVAIDQRGYNLSDKPQGIENYTIDELVNDVKEVIETLGYDKAIVVAHDWGGCVAWQFAEKYPDMVDKLIACNIPRPGVLVKHMSSTWSQFRKSWYMFFYQSDKIPEMMNAADDMKMLEMCFRAPNIGLVNKENMKDEDIEAWKYSFSQNGASFKYPINYYRNILNDHFLHGQDKQLDMPILLIWGMKDSALEYRTAVKTMKTVSNGRLIRLDASHWVQQDTPKEVNYNMRQFLEHGTNFESKDDN